MRAVIAAALLAASAPATVLAQAPSAALQLKAVPLTIKAANGRRLRYAVEVAHTPREQEIGLMFRRSMPANHGMIFPMQPQRVASFWMMNTYIPLDLVFVRKDGTISSIAANATPLSTAPISSTEPIAAVLELNGGEAARAGVRAGDKVHW